MAAREEAQPPQKQAVSYGCHGDLPSWGAAPPQLFCRSTVTPQARTLTKKKLLMKEILTKPQLLCSLNPDFSF